MKRFASLLPTNRGKIMVPARLALGLALTVFAFSHSYALSIAVMVIMGMGQVGHSNMGTLLVHSLAVKEYLGRSMSILLMGQACTYLTSTLLAFKRL